jgi:hypothetical protein
VLELLIGPPGGPAAIGFARRDLRFALAPLVESNHGEQPLPALCTSPHQLGRIEQGPPDSMSADVDAALQAAPARSPDVLVGPGPFERL